MNHTEKEQQKKKKPSGSSGFLPFAIFVFAALAIGLVVIIMRSQA
jgi:hypothetical protein